MPPTDTVLSPRRRGAAALLAAAAIGVIIAGCGGSSPPSSSTGSGSPQAKGPGADAYQYSACMRTHGVSGFPDPVVKVNGEQRRRWPSASRRR